MPEFDGLCYRMSFFCYLHFKFRTQIDKQSYHEVRMLQSDLDQTASDAYSTRYGVYQ